MATVTRFATSLVLLSLPFAAAAQDVPPPPPGLSDPPASYDKPPPAAPAPKKPAPKKPEPKHSAQSAEAEPAPTTIAPGTTAATPTTTVTAPPAAAPPSGPATPPAGAAAGTGAACVPACREGYTCVEGQCVSACNPPCNAGERCVDGMRCEAYRQYPTGTAPVYYAPPPAQRAPRPGARKHDGFMLRLSLGLGAGAAAYENGSEDVVLSGFSPSFAIDAGASPIENLVLHARIATFLLDGATADLSIDGDNDPDFNEDYDGESYGTWLFGPAVTYYVMPINLYFTGVFGLSGFTGDDGIRDDDESELGWGANIDIGKEWWLGSSWGLGAAGRVWLGMIPDQSITNDVDIFTTNFSVLFSATFQ